MPATQRRRHQVAIIGGGPSGLLLGLLLARAGLDIAILERRSRDYVLSRIRAGVLEAGTVETLRRAGLAERMDREGTVHDGCAFALANRMFRVDFVEACGRAVMVYGQTEVTRDLYDAHARLHTPIHHEVDDVAIEDADTEHPLVTFTEDGTPRRIDCDVVVGCDGFYGVSRQTIPAARRNEFHKTYPFGWLGVLSRTPPVDDELIYANHPRGFALASMRSATLSRYYVQVPEGAAAEAWTDDTFWDELRRRLPNEAAERLVTGRSVEKSIAPLRSFVCEPMRWGRLFLAGDAAHIVPPTGAKGLNLAVSDVHYLSAALIAFFLDRDADALDAYSGRALQRVWQAIRFSWWMTHTLHYFPGQSAFDQRLQEWELEAIARSPHARAALAENYTGLPY